MATSLSGEAIVTAVGNFFITSSAKLGPDNTETFLPVRFSRIEDTVSSDPCSIPLDALTIITFSDK